MNTNYQNNESSLRRETAGNTIKRNVASMIGSHTLWLGVASVLCGAAAAALNRINNPWIFILLLLYVVTTQAMGNVLHNYSEIIHDTGHVKRKLQINDMSPAKVYNSIWKSFGILSCMIGLVIMTIAGVWLIAFGAVIMISVWLLYLTKRPLIATPWCILFTFILFGPVGVFGSCFAMIPDPLNRMDEFIFIEPAILMSIICGLMAASCHLLYSYQLGREAKTQRRETFTNKFGMRTTRWTFLIFGLLIAACIMLIAEACPQIQDFGPAWWTLFGLTCIFLYLRFYIFFRMPRTNLTFLGDMQKSVDMMSCFICFLLLVIFYFVGLREATYFV